MLIDFNTFEEIADQLVEKKYITIHKEHDYISFMVRPQRTKELTNIVKNKVDDLYDDLHDENCICFTSRCGDTIRGEHTVYVMMDVRDLNSLLEEKCDYRTMAYKIGNKNITYIAKYVWDHKYITIDFGYKRPYGSYFGCNIPISNFITECTEGHVEKIVTRGQLPHGLQITTPRADKCEQDKTNTEENKIINDFNQIINMR